MEGNQLEETTYICRYPVDTLLDVQKIKVPNECVIVMLELLQ